MTLPEPARAVCETWLAEMDRTAPGLVTGLHVRGGIGFGEFVLGKSDVDFVAVLSRRPTMADEDLIEAAHGVTSARHPDVPFDGLHLLAEDLAADPEDCPDVPCVLHGYFEPAARYDLSPVAWHELAGHSVTVRGELPEVWTDRERLLSFGTTSTPSGDATPRRWPSFRPRRRPSTPASGACSGWRGCTTCWSPAR